MKVKLLRVMAFLLTISLLVGLVPMISLAADNELVLTKLGHNNTDIISISAPSTRAVTLSVPYLYAGSTVDLTDGGLKIDKASTISSVVTTFESGSTATVGNPGAPGPAVMMTVKYYKGSDPTQYTALYSISVIRMTRKDPSFTGAITKSVTGVMPNAAVNDITFSANDFANLYKANDGGPISKISISGISLACGSLKIANGAGTYANYTAGNMIDFAVIGNLVFDALDGGSVSYLVSAYAGANTSTPVGSVLLNIDVKDITAPTLNANNTVVKSVNGGSIATFAMSDFNSLCNLNYGSLKSIEITPTNNAFGVWSNGSTQFTNATTFTDATIGNLKFTGSAAGSAAFTWRASNEAGFSLPGSGTITVTLMAVPTITAGVTKSVAVSSTLTFSMSDFSSCYNLNNGTFASIVITPTNNSYGTWYKGSNPFYSAVSFTAIEIASLQFRGTQAGQATFNWNVSNEKGASAAGSGSVTVTTATGSINYTTAQNTAKTFALSDFNTACYNATAGTLSYILFTSISSSSGSLYYGYSSPSNPGSAIGLNSAYYSQYVSGITFVPASNYTGTVTITYTGASTAGTSFTGSITIAVGGTSDVNYSTAQNAAKTFSASDFNVVCTNATSSSLNYIYFPSAPSSGTLYYGYSSPSSPGSAVSLNTAYYYNGTPYISYITFVPASNFTGTVTIPYVAYSASGSPYSGTARITVGGSTSDINYTTPLNMPKTFIASDFTTACNYATNGGTLSYVYFTSASPTNAALYYGYTSPSSPGTPVTSSAQIASAYLSGITLVPPSNYNGTITIAYTGVTTGGTSFTGSIKVTAGATSDLTYSTAVNTPKTFSTPDFVTAASNLTNGGTLSYLSFAQLSATYGALYLGYSSAAAPGTAISPSTQITSPYLSSVTFVPASNYTGTFTIAYSGVTTGGTTFTGSVKITVGGTSDVTYSTAVNTPKTFAATDFNTAVSSITGGGTLSYLYFTPPSATYGALYYGYTSASAPGAAMGSSNQIVPSYLSNITFVPASNYAGTVTITYTGVTTGGTSFTGYVKITVGSSGSSNVSYSITKNTAKTFSAAEFNTECTAATGIGLSSIILNPLSSAYGTIYKDYVSSTSPGTAISASTIFHVTGTPPITSVTFVPTSNYIGTVTIPYTGFNTNGVQYQGSIVIKITGPASDISITLKNNQTIKFSSTDINTVCYNATGANLSYITFILPYTTYGKLYYNYTSATSPGTAVTASTSYYAEAAPDIDNVTFVPAATYTGNVIITYTGYNINGTSYTGRFNIQINKSTGSSHFTDVGQSYDWASGAIDFLYDAGIVTGTGGTLYSPSTNMSRGDFILMLYRAMAFSGSTSSNFADVPKGSYYYDAIAAAKALGIAQGTNNKINPTAAITRQDAMVFIYRALLLTGKNLTTGSSSDISGFTDKGSIASYALTAVQTLVKAGIIKGTNSKLNPTGNLSRAEMAVVVYRVKTTY